MLSDTVRNLIQSVPPAALDGHAAFVANLKFAHGIMRASAPLLELGAAKASGSLRDYYRSHLLEERDHADWLAEDMKSLGEEPQVIDHAAAATAGAQYYYLQHVGPHPLLGYIAALEFCPMSLEDVETLTLRYGKAATRTIRYHAMHDPEHAKDLACVIDQHEQFADLICYSAFVTSKMFAYYLNDRIKTAAGGTK